MKLNNSILVRQTMNDLSSAHLDQNRHLEKITRGVRIARAADDAAALAVSENLDAQARSMVIAQRNINDGIAILDILHGGISEIVHSVKRLYEMTVQASSETLAQDERDQLQLAANQETLSIIHTASSTHWTESRDDFGDLMLYGPQDSVDVQAGTGSTTADRINIDTFDAGTFWFDDGGGVNANRVYYNIGPLDPTGWPNKDITDVHVFDYSSATSAQTALNKAVQQLDFLNAQLAANGASRNQLSRAMYHLQAQGNVISGARAQIKDADFALEAAGFVKSQIMAQSGTSVMAQANRMSEGALRLLS
jgi:flagellin